ncbi:MAG: LysM peptidoglycan-binding domain-containing protein [Acidobacteriota bacterium]
MRLHHKATVLGVSVLASGVLACGSANHELSPEAPAIPEEAARPLAEAPAEPDPAPAADFEPLDQAFADASTGREPLEGLEPSDELASEPELMQKEALELCQSAEQLLDQGEVEGALQAVDRAYELMLDLPGNGDDAFLQAKEDIRLLVADLISRSYNSGRRAAARPRASWDLELPMVDNEYVRREIESFTTKERQQFIDGYRRSGRFRPMILSKLEEAGLPSQLSWLPMVESWFKVRAYSRASAVGMWQFISSTGQRYGLSRDSWVDERFDPEKSTDAAIGYLVDLHGMFGDWPKALAAYNCGEARVQRLQRRSATEYLDFWDLYELLPRETRRYVPRLFAALQIIENPEKYGMTLPRPDDPPGETTNVTVARAVKLEALDSLLGLDKGTLGDLNPELRYRGTPKRAYELKIPSGREQTLIAGIGSVREWRPPQTRYVIHRVRRGQTLSVIARRYGTSVRAIMLTNNLRSANRIREGQRLRIPVRGSGAVRRTSRTAVNGVHTVRRGESLGAIARAYGTTVSRLKRDNNLSSDVIYPGQRLRVGPASSSGSGGKSYTVARGDTLGKIADRHGVGLSALLRANGLSTRSTIYPGQKLVIP